MRRLSRPQEPEGFVEVRQHFSKHYPPAAQERTEGARWAAFKNEEQAMYAQVKNVLFQNQQGLCAFCECKLTENNREIEHFFPKSASSAAQDWTINFSNYTLSCKGKRTPAEEDHCGHCKDATNPEGKILCPYELPAFPLVRMESGDREIRFLPDVAACRKADIDVGLVQMTLDYLGLNCRTLMESRWEVWNSLLDQIAAVDTLTEEEQEEELRSIVEDSMLPEDGLLKPFVTVRLLTFAKELPQHV